MSKKAEPKVYMSVGWPCLRGKRIVYYTIKQRLPYTAVQLARRQARLVASASKSDV